MLVNQISEPQGKVHVTTVEMMLGPHRIQSAVSQVLRK